jgi:hypothetical protein
MSCGIGSLSDGISSVYPSIKQEGKIAREGERRREKRRAWGKISFGKAMPCEAEVRAGFKDFVYTIGSYESRSVFIVLSKVRVRDGGKAQYDTSHC